MRYSMSPYYHMRDADFRMATLETLIGAAVEYINQCHHVYHCTLISGGLDRCRFR